MRSLAFGVERIGLLPLRFPMLVGVAAALLMAFAAFGVARLKVDDSLSQLFKSDTPEFRQYEEATARFPSTEYDVLIVVEGARLLEREPLDHFRDLVTDLQLIEGTRGIVSIFSARQPAASAIPPPLFPAELPEGRDYDALIARVKSNEIIRGADDGPARPLHAGRGFRGRRTGPRPCDAGTAISPRRPTSGCPRRPPVQDRLSKH